jgi:uncharacterized membrane protein
MERQSHDRIKALTDGVFAIVMTLLVLELSLPLISGGAGKQELIPSLMAL